MAYHLSPALGQQKQEDVWLFCKPELYSKTAFDREVWGEKRKLHKDKRVYFHEGRNQFVLPCKLNLLGEKFEYS